MRNPITVLIRGYMFLTLAGFTILCLPWAQTLATPWLDNLFIAASAISTTGLVSVSVSDHYSFFGEIAVLTLIQVGGLGFMTFGSLAVLIRRKPFSEFHEKLIQSDFGLPPSFHVKEFVKVVLLFSCIVEALGAAALYVFFKESGTPQPLWAAVFHSVSAFCTAGFSLFNNSFEGFRDHLGVNLIITALSFLGAVGFILVADFWNSLRTPGKALTLTSKIILGFSFLMIGGGWLLLLLTEPTFSGPLTNQWLPSLFQSMSAMTTVGFNTVPISGLSHGSQYLLTLLMIVGASPAGTGGGIKSTTITAVLAETLATLRGKRVVMFFGRVIPDYRLQQASASFNFYILLLTFGIYLLTLTEGKLFIFDIIFEATSAIGTVGLSTGITSSLSFLGKWVVIGLMMLGRIGPLSLGLAIFYSKKEDDLWNARYEDVVID
ncbi:MAG: TrkH family potassium uptake protein [Candidatus Omnitrophota bacterium]